MCSIAELVAQMNEASNAYYNTGTSLMSDKEFDALLAKISSWEREHNCIGKYTDKVGAPVLDELLKVDIEGQPMLSLGKVHSSKEVMDFYDAGLLVASVKCDGLSTRLIYNDGRLISANTRGDGYVGTDVTDHARYFTNIPLTIDYEGKLVIDGESIITNSDFEMLKAENDKLRNSRNLAAGTLGSLTLEDVKKRKLTFLAWDVIEGFEDSHSYSERLTLLAKYGFSITPFTLVNDLTIEKIDETNTDILDLANLTSIPCDGVVWRIDDNLIGKEKGKTQHHFLNAVAWKPEDDEYETELLDIEWSMGRTGVLTPVAIYKDVEMDGCICNRANLFNYSTMVEKLGEYPYLYQKIYVTKKNKIIPYVTRAEDKGTDPHDHAFEMPRTCPCCGEVVSLEETEGGVLVLKCNNSNCVGNLSNRIDHFFGKTGLDAKGFSKATIEKLIDMGWLNSISDVFKLEEHKTEWTNLPGFGVASVTKILNAIKESCDTTLEKVIAGTGIPLVGRAAASVIAAKFGDYNSFRDYIKEGNSFVSWDGFGLSIHEALSSYDYTELDEIVDKYLTINKVEKEETDNKLDGLTFVLTGKSSIGSRDKVKALIESNGGKVVGSVSSKTNYLLSNAVEDTTKYNTAKRLEIPIITDKDLLEMI